MEDNSNIQQQNRTLKIILIVLTVLIVIGAFIVAIAGTYYFATRSDDNGMASKKSTLPEVNRGQPAGSANSGSAVPNTPAAPVPTTTPTPAPATPTPERNNFALVGRWIETNPHNGDKYTHVFESPKKVGNNLTGSIRFIEPQGKERRHTYTVISSSKITINYDEDPTQGEECFYDIESGGRSVKLTCGGRIASLTRAR